MEISFTSSFSKGDDGQLFNSNKYSAVQLTPSIGYMLSDKTMVGAGFEATSSRYQNGSRTFYTQSSYGISPYGRYYFYSKEKLSSFLFINSAIAHFKYKNESDNFFSENGWAINASGGFGAQYYFAPNLAVHGEMGTILFENKNGGSYSHLVFANIGFRTFLNDRTPWEGDLMKSYLKKGNFVFGGEIDITSDNNDQDGINEINQINAKSMLTTLTVKPSLTSFLKDKLAVSIEPGFTKSGNGNYKQSSYSLDFSLEGYVPLGERFYFVPSVEIGFQKRNSKYYSVEPIFFGPIGGSVMLDTILRNEPNILNTGKLTLSFKYFTKGAAIFSTGVFYGVDHYVVKKYDYTRANNKWGINVGLEYFLAKNISFNTVASYSSGESRFEYGGAYPFIDTSGDEKIGIDFSINYFIFR